MTTLFRVCTMLLLIIGIARPAASTCSPPTFAIPFDVTISAAIPGGLDVCGFQITAVMSPSSDCDGSVVHFAFAATQPSNWLVSENCEAFEEGKYVLVAVYDSSAPTFLTSGVIGTISLTHRGCFACACAPVFSVTGEQVVVDTGDTLTEVTLATTYAVSICDTQTNCD